MPTLPHPSLKREHQVLALTLQHLSLQGQETLVGRTEHVQNEGKDTDLLSKTRLGPLTTASIDNFGIPWRSEAETVTGQTLSKTA